MEGICSMLFLYLDIFGDLPDCFFLYFWLMLFKLLYYSMYMRLEDISINSADGYIAVSYTHLTLPTNREV